MERPTEIGRKSWVKNLLPKTLLGRSLLIMITPVFLIQVISTFMFFDRHWNKMATRLSYAVAGELVLLGTLIENNPDPEGVQALTALAGDKLGLIINYEPAAILEEKAEEKISERWADYIAQTFTHELSQQTSKKFTVDVDFEEKWVEVGIQLEKGVLRASLPQRRLFTSTTYIFLLWVYGSSAVLLLIAVLFMRNQVRPIRKLAIAAERFGKGRDVQNFKVEGAREVRLAGQAFVDMRTRIQRQIQQRTAMLAGVSHDLRTPLTRMKLQLALLGDSPDIDAMKGDIDEMEKMIDGYLNFVRGEGNETPEITNLVDLTQSVMVAAKRQGCEINFSFDKNETLTIPLRPLAMKRCLTNLIGNAAKYAKTVWISIGNLEKESVLIQIEDDGPGIPEEQHEDVFRPFYRVDSSRNTQTGGVGLGLPIARDIVHAHGGVIDLSRSRHGGLAVKIILPR